MVKHMIHTNTLVGWTRQCSVKMKDREPSRKKNEMMESGKTATSPLKKLRFTIFVSPICARSLGHDLIPDKLPWSLFLLYRLREIHNTIFKG